MSDNARRRESRLDVFVLESTGTVPAAAGLARWLREVAPPAARGSATIALVSDAVVRRLNRRFRGVDRVTDVLSFAVPVGAPDWRPRSEERWLGDIVIALGVARHQAKAAGHHLRMELRVLALHGLLHLLGYDHEADAGQMARLEARLRRRGRLSSGLLERAS